MSIFFCSEGSGRKLNFCKVCGVGTWAIEGVGSSCSNWCFVRDLLCFLKRFFGFLRGIEFLNFNATEGKELFLSLFFGVSIRRFFIYN